MRGSAHPLSITLQTYLLPAQPAPQPLPPCSQQSLAPSQTLPPWPHPPPQWPQLQLQLWQPWSRGGRPEGGKGNRPARQHRSKGVRRGTQAGSWWRPTLLSACLTTAGCGGRPGSGCRTTMTGGAVRAGGVCGPANWPPRHGCSLRVASHPGQAWPSAAAVKPRLRPSNPSQHIRYSCATPLLPRTRATPRLTSYPPPPVHACANTQVFCGLLRVGGGVAR